MGNCAGYCNGQGENEEGQIRQSFNKQDMIANQHNDFEQRYGKYCHIPCGLGPF
jgi:hypothetical protein